MPKLIPQDFINDLLAKIDIVDIVSSRIKLKKMGSNLAGLCPFHLEKTPSFTVSQPKQFFHCFGCHAHGSAIGFVMQFEHLSFVEAVENLASQANLTLPQINSQHNKVPYDELYQVTKKVATFFEQQLPRSSRAITYLKSRGLTGEICKKFKVGYALNAWDNLQPLYSATPTLKQQLITTGLLIVKDRNTYARFRDRIIFPIRNTRGHIIGFGGRTLNNSDPAKYLNSPETPIFHKGEELYGLYEAKTACRNLSSLIIVEGYLDVIALAQFGILNVAATLGTAISTKQIQLLLRYTSEIVFCFDGDRAGHAAAWRALENSLPIMREGIQIKFLFLPDGDDPDSLIRKEAKESFDQRLATALPLSEFFIKQLASRININTIDGKAKLVNTGRELLNKMPRGIFHQLLSSKIAQLININPEELVDHGPKSEPIIAKYPVASPPLNSTNKAEMPVPIQNIISILLHHPQLLRQFDNMHEIQELKLDGIELLLELITLLQNQVDISMGAILEYWRDRPELTILNKLACKEPIISKDVLKNVLIDIIHSLKHLEREQMIQALLAKATTAPLDIAERKQLQHLIEASKKIG